jgi:hypothetical protein
MQKIDDCKKIRLALTRAGIATRPEKCIQIFCLVVTAQYIYRRMITQCQRDVDTEAKWSTPYATSSVGPSASRLAIKSILDHSVQNHPKPGSFLSSGVSSGSGLTPLNPTIDHTYICIYIYVYIYIQSTHLASIVTPCPNICPTIFYYVRALDRCYQYTAL